MSETPDILIQEVCPRDGLQIEPVFVSRETEIHLVDRRLRPERSEYVLSY